MVYFGPKVPEKKFIKDNMNRDDIDGATTKSRFVYKQRDHMKIDDIEGARS